MRREDLAIQNLGQHAAVFVLHYLLPPLLIDQQLSLGAYVCTCDFRLTSVVEADLST